MTDEAMAPDDDRLTTDVVVVGGSVAGCMAAVLLARQGLEVTVLERQLDMAAYKSLCTHFIQPTALPALRRSGLAALIDGHGGVRSATDVWLPWGWVRSRLAPEEQGYNIGRDTLDLLMRRLAMSTPGVTLRLGHTVREVFRSDGRVNGVLAWEEASGRPLFVQAALVVGADGRQSTTARLAGLIGVRRPNARFANFATYENPRRGPDANRRRVWFLGASVAIESPADGGRSVFAVYADKRELPVWRIDARAALRRAFRDVPDGVDLAAVRRAGPLHGVLEIPNVSRPVAVPGLALIGDAAVTVDPVFAVGCGWAFESAEWLARAAGPALRDHGAAGVDTALAAYARVHAADLLPRYDLMSRFSTGRRLSLGERLVAQGAVHDRRLGEVVQLLAGGALSLGAARRPRLFLRAMGARLRGPAPVRSITGSV